jgi:predicted ferric reductase
VIHNILQSDRPGVYSCGPRPLMESLERAIRNKRTDCAFYQEDSEM